MHLVGVYEGDMLEAIVVILDKLVGETALLLGLAFPRRQDPSKVVVASLGGE